MLSKTTKNTSVLRVRATILVTVVEVGGFLGRILGC